MKNSKSNKVDSSLKNQLPMVHKLYQHYHEYFWKNYHTPFLKSLEPYSIDHTNYDSKIQKNPFNSPYSEILKAEVSQSQSQLINKSILSQLEHYQPQKVPDDQFKKLKDQNIKIKESSQSNYVSQIKEPLILAQIIQSAQSDIAGQVEGQEEEQIIDSYYMTQQSQKARQLLSIEDTKKLKTQSCIQSYQSKSSEVQKNLGKKIQVLKQEKIVVSQKQMQPNQFEKKVSIENDEKGIIQNFIPQQCEINKNDEAIIDSSKECNEIKNQIKTEQKISNEQILVDKNIVDKDDQTQKKQNMASSEMQLKTELVNQNQTIAQSSTKIKNQIEDQQTKNESKPIQQIVQNQIFEETAQRDQISQLMDDFHLFLNQSNQKCSMCQNKQRQYMINLENKQEQIRILKQKIQTLNLQKIQKQKTIYTLKSQIFQLRKKMNQHKDLKVQIQSSNIVKTSFINKQGIKRQRSQQNILEKFELHHTSSDQSFPKEQSKSQASQVDESKIQKQSRKDSSESSSSSKS